MQTIEPVIDCRGLCTEQASHTRAFHLCIVVGILCQQCTASMALTRISSATNHGSKQKPKQSRQSSAALQHNRTFESHKISSPCCFCWYLVVPVKQKRAHCVLAALALAVVVMDVDRVLQVWICSCDLIYGVHHEVQHVFTILESIPLTPSHVLQAHAHFI